MKEPLCVGCLRGELVVDKDGVITAIKCPVDDSRRRCDECCEHWIPLKARQCKVL